MPPKNFSSLFSSCKSLKSRKNIKESQKYQKIRPQFSKSFFWVSDFESFQLRVMVIGHIILNEYPPFFPKETVPCSKKLFCRKPIGQVLTKQSSASDFGSEPRKKSFKKVKDIRLRNSVQMKEKISDKVRTTKRLSEINTSCAELETPDKILQKRYFLFFEFS